MTTRLYGKVKAQARDRLHLRLTRRAARVGHDKALPIITDTAIRLRNISLNPWRSEDIIAAALAILHPDYGRTT